MTTSNWLQLAGIPLAIAGACLSWIMGPPMGLPIAALFVFMALALTAALIWGRE